MNFNLISISLDGNLKDCVDLMKKNKIHRVIVEDTKTNANTGLKSNSFTGFITYETIFEYFVSHYYSDMLAFHVAANETNIVTNKLVIVDKNETIYDCLLKFWIHKISIIPIYDHETETLFGFFYLKDIVYFFANGEKFGVFFYLK